MATPQRQPKLLQWAVPALTGAVLVVNARMGEQQRPPSSPAGCSAASDHDEPPGPWPTLPELLGGSLDGWLSAVGRFHH